MKRIGFACKYMTPTGETPRELNTTSTTLTWVNKQQKHVAEERLWQISQHNISSVMNMLAKVKNMDPQLRMVRLSSDLLPLYTEPSWSYFWQQSETASVLQTQFAKIGEFARTNNIRLSFHPGQFCCIVSHNNDIVQRSLQELEYHATMAKWMGFGVKKLDFKINIHLSGKLGLDAFDNAWNQMSPELKNCLTIENDEFQSDLSTVINLKHRVGIVFDIHHEWIASGEYLPHKSPYVDMILESWGGVRPVMHLSMSPRDLLSSHDTNTLPSLPQLLSQGYKKQQLRSHSNELWNLAVCDYVQEFWQHFDIMTETKFKNLSSHFLLERFVGDKQQLTNLENSTIIDTLANTDKEIVTC